MTRTPDKFIAAAFFELADSGKPLTITNFGAVGDGGTDDTAAVFNACKGEPHAFVKAFTSGVLQRAEELHQHELNPPRVKCSKCPGRMVIPTPCMNPDCGFRK